MTRITKPITFLVGFSVTLAGGCDDVARCDAPLEQLITIDGSLIEGSGSIGSAEVTLRGFLQRPDNLAIYALTIAGQPATDEGDDFRQFSVKIPQATKLEHSGGETLLHVAVFSNCGAGSLEPLAVAAPSATSLRITPEPSPPSYLPLSPITPLKLVVSADSESHAAADGLPVALSATLGSLAPAMLVLADDGASSTATTYLLLPDREGQAIVTARNGKLEASVAVVFLGPPQLLPATGPLYRDTPREVMVILPSAGGVTAELAQCDVASAPDVTVTGPTNGKIRIAPAVNAVAGHAAHIICRDKLGQAVSADFVVVVP